MSFTVIMHGPAGIVRGIFCDNEQQAAKAMDSAEFWGCEVVSVKGDDGSEWSEWTDDFSVYRQWRP
jgi:hypothetical protein